MRPGCRRIALLQLARPSAEARLDAVRVRGAQFDAQHARLLAVGDQRRQVPVLAPEVGDQPELHLEILGPDCSQDVVGKD